MTTSTVVQPYTICIVAIELTKGEKFEVSTHVLLSHSCTASLF